jgi:hypothetical protein
MVLTLYEAIRYYLEEALIPVRYLLPSTLLPSAVCCRKHSKLPKYYLQC